MRLRSLVAALLAVAAACAPERGTSPSPTEPSFSVTPGAARYVVVFRDNVASADVPGLARAMSQAHGSVPDFVYQHALHGFAAVLSDRAVAALAADPRVRYVEPDQVMEAVAQSLPWGIDRIDADVSSTLAGNGSGAVTNVNVYIIDTGIDRSHPDLNVVEHVNFAGGPNKDCNGHGTHVSGTVAAKDDAQGVVGVVPGAPLHGVKVLGCGGSGTTSGVIAGVDWVTQHAIKPAVANMSLGGGASTALDDAVRNSAGSGVVYALAAGNSGANACNASPARAGAGTNNGIITLSAIDQADNEASFSNFGSCVDMAAPGVSILSTYKGGGYATLSGTSMASPHAAGTAALYLSSHPTASPGSVEAQMKLDNGGLSKNSKDGSGDPIVSAGKY
jgi:subtilisin family serine protease